MMSANDAHEFGRIVDSPTCNKRGRLADSDELCEGFKLRKTSLPISSRDESSPEEKKRRVELYNKFVDYFMVPESQIAHQSDIEEVVDPDPIACAWLLEPDWHDQAYKELLFLRNMHSSLLEEEYKQPRGRRFKSINAAVAHKKHLKKLLMFLGKSKDEIGALPREECYDCLMDIKCVVAYNAKQDSNQLQQPASIEYTGKTQFHNWRDQTYEQLQSLRKMYSYKLDDAYKYVHGGHTQSKLLTGYREECLSFLKESLDFLANSRVNILYLLEKMCCKSLKAIERFVEDDNDFLVRRMYLALRESARFLSCENYQESSLPNWRDAAYEQIQSMRDGVPLDDYRFGYAMWSEMPELYESVDELEECIDRAMRLFSMPRHAMALLSEEEYTISAKETTQVLGRIDELMRHLQKIAPIEL